MLEQISFKIGKTGHNCSRNIWIIKVGVKDGMQNKWDNATGLILIDDKSIMIYLYFPRLRNAIRPYFIAIDHTMVATQWKIDIHVDVLQECYGK